MFGLSSSSDWLFPIFFGIFLGFFAGLFYLFGAVVFAIYLMGISNGKMDLVLFAMTMAGFLSMMIIVGFLSGWDVESLVNQAVSFFTTCTLASIYYYRLRKKKGNTHCSACE